MVVIGAGTRGVLFRLCCCLRPYKLAGLPPTAPTQRGFVLAASSPASLAFKSSSTISPDPPQNWAQSHYRQHNLFGVWEGCLEWLERFIALAQLPCSVRRASLVLFVFLGTGCYCLPFIAFYDSKHFLLFRRARGMLFTAVICNQQTRSPLNPLVSSMDVAGEMELWLMHGLFCLWERGRVCDSLQ